MSDVIVTVDVVRFERALEAVRLVRHPGRLFGDWGDPASAPLRMVMTTGRGAELFAPWKPQDVSFRANGRRLDGWGLPDLRRLAIIASWDDERDAERFARSRLRSAAEHWRGIFDPVNSHGSMWGRDPLGGGTGGRTAGPGAILTWGRGRSHFLQFVRKNNRVVEDIHRREGVLTAVALGGRSIRVVGTFSCWTDLADAMNFAYRGAEHRDAIRQMREGRWSHETWFARLVLIRSEGTLAGRDPFEAVVPRREPSVMA